MKRKDRIISIIENNSPELAAEELVQMLRGVLMAGDEAKIVRCIRGHDFEIGDYVKLIEYSGTMWLAENNSGKRWYVVADEIEVI